MQRLFAALTAFAFIIALLAMESPVIIRRFCGEAVGEEVLPNFKKSKIAFCVHKHRFVWLPPLSVLLNANRRSILPFLRRLSGFDSPGRPGWSNEAEKR